VQQLLQNATHLPQNPQMAMSTKKFLQASCHRFRLRFIADQ
jgi:hypothetical protein